MRENNTHHSIGVELIAGLKIIPLLLLIACQNKSRDDDAFLLNPATDSPYNYKVYYTENISVRQASELKKTAFTISFQPVSDSIYAFNFRFTEIDTSILRYLDRMDSLHKRSPDKNAIFRRAEYSSVFKEAIRDVFHGRVDRKGQVISLNGFDAMKARIKKEIRLDSRDYVSMLQEETGDPAVEKLLNMLFMCIAGKQVKVEDNWVRNVIDNTRSPIKHSHLVTFIAQRKDTAIMNVQTEISAKTAPEGTLFESGKGGGEWKIDRRTGLPYEWNSRYETQYRTAYDTSTRTIVVKGELMQ